MNKINTEQINQEEQINFINNRVTNISPTEQATILYKYGFRLDEDFAKTGLYTINKNGKVGVFIINYGIVQFNGNSLFNNIQIINFISTNDIESKYHLAIKNGNEKFYCAIEKNNDNIKIINIDNNIIEEEIKKVNMHLEMLLLGESNENRTENRTLH